MFTDPSFSTPQGGDLKGVNSPNPRPPPSTAFTALTAAGTGEPARGGSTGTSAPDARSPALTFPLTHRPLLVALAGFLPKTGPKPPQIQGNQAKPPAAHHSTTAAPTPTTTAHLARSPDAAPTRSPRRAHQGPDPPVAATTAAAAALAGVRAKMARDRADSGDFPANAACTDSHTAHHALHPTHPWPASPITHPGTTNTPTTSSTRREYGS